MRIRLLLLLITCSCYAFKPAMAQISYRTESRSSSGSKAWVDSVYSMLSPEERIGQLFMVAAYSGGKNYNEGAILKLIENHQVGGLIFMQGGPARQALLTNKYQKLAQVPLLISMDAEWGLGMRLDSVMSFPRQMMLGATRDTALMYQVGMAIAYQCRRLGVHINFSPDVDINNNAGNPVINSRSFGEQKQWVTLLGKAYMKGLQDNGVMACLKHFPGHGNTDVDSHKDLPVIRQSLQELHATELYPFKQLIREGAQSVMIAHLDVPALETQLHIPTTLSKNTVTGLLKEELGFRGLVFTDALNMDGVAKYFEPGEVDLRAFIAGNDVLLFSQNVPVAIEKIKSAIAEGTVSEEALAKSVKKILMAKYRYGLHRFKPISTQNITNDLNQFTLSLRSKVSEAAATLLRDKNKMIEVLSRPGQKVQYVGVNASSSVLERELVGKFEGMASTWLPAGSKKSALDDIAANLSAFDANIIAIHGTSFYPAKNYNLDPALLQFVQSVQNHPRTVLVLLGNAYLMQQFCDVQSAIVLYEDDSSSQKIMAEVLSGNIPAKGNLPVTVCPDMKSGEQYTSQATIPYDLKQIDKPASGGIVVPDAINKLDALMNRCVNERVFPGARVMALQNGKVIYNKSFGYFDYRKQTPVTTNTIYDVASLTKVLSTTLAVMKLYEEGEIELDKRLKDYLPWVAGTDKANISIRNLLLHQAGLKSWIPFYKETTDPISGALRSDLYHTTASGDWNVPVAANLYLDNKFIDTIWKRILDQPLEITGKYTYSDLDFYFLQKVVEEVNGKSLNAYVQQSFYTPMGLKEISYRPLKKFPLSQIAPTENDAAFRHQQIQGYVHDQGAALLGGVAGHAGLFATAEDVAAVFQMLQQNGVYNGKRYFKESTVKKFTAYNAFGSRRGLGFDKAGNERNDAGPCGERCSGYTFGHQGFTGTCAWADPANGIVFVFLSNRVYPSAENNGINRLNVRTAVQDYIYEALGIPVNKNRPEVYQTQLKSIR
jgi:beta-N-acetylhexosaminidase